MTWGEFLISGWSWHPEVILGCSLLALIYLILARFSINRYTAFFLTGVLLLFLTLESPLDILSDDYLFSAHMLQHIILVFFVSPLLLLGLPSEWIKRILMWKPAALIENILGRPPLAWVIGVSTLYFWHLPPVYNAALQNESIHSLQHLSFLVAATIFWWPVILPIQEKRRLSPFETMVYVFAGALANTVLGIILTFAPLGLYPAYINPEDAYGILPLIRDGWGLNPLNDQQLGGLLMWIGGGLIYLSVILIVFAYWYSHAEMEVT